MLKIKAFLWLAFFALFGGAAQAQVAGNPACTVYRDTGQGLTAGLWRICSTGGHFVLDQNTSARGNFSTYTRLDLGTITSGGGGGGGGSLTDTWTATSGLLAPTDPTDAVIAGGVTVPLSSPGAILASVGPGLHVFSGATANENDLSIHAGASLVTIEERIFGTASHVPIAFRVNGAETFRLATEGFMQLSTSYSGSNLCPVGSAAIRNNGGSLEKCENGVSWTAIGSGGGGSLTGTGTNNRLSKWTSSTNLGNTTIDDDGATVTFNSLPTITNNAIGFFNSSKQLTTAEGYLNWDNVNHLLYVGFGPMTDFAGTTGVVASGAVGFTVSTATSNASTGNLNVVSGQYVSVNAGRTGSGTRLPFVIFTGGAETFRLSTDPFLQLTNSYTGSNVCGAGTVGLRNNSGTLEKCENGGTWGAIGGGGGGLSGSGTTNAVMKWTGGTAAGNSSITDDGSNVVVGDLPAITNNALLFANSSKQLKSDEGYLNWDSTNKRLYTGFGPMTDLTGSGQLVASGSGGLIVSTANSNASTMAINVVAGTYASFNAGRTGSGTRLPIVFFTNAAETLRLTTDPFIQLTTSYTGSTTCAAGSVGLRNNGGTLQKCENGGAWASLSGGTVTGSGSATRIPVWTSSTGLTNSSIIDNSGAISGPGSIALGPGTLPANTVFYGSSDTGSLYTISYANSSAGSGAFSCLKSRGTHASPSDVQSGDAICSMISSGYSGGGFLGTSKIVFRATSVSSGQRPGNKIEFSTNVVNSAQAINMVLQDNGVLTLGTYGAGTATFDASGNISSSSDERLKDVSGFYGAGLAEIQKLNPIVYRWNELSGLEREHDYAGFGAKNVRDALPLSTGVRPDGYLTLQDRAILAALVNAVKELDERTKRPQ